MKQKSTSFGLDENGNRLTFSQWRRVVERTYPDARLDSLLDGLGEKHAAAVIGLDAVSKWSRAED